MSASEHPDRGGLQACEMGALINSPRESRDDNVTGLAQAARQAFGESESSSGSIARTDDRDRGPAQRLRAPSESENSAARESISCNTAG